VKSPIRSIKERIKNIHPFIGICLLFLILILPFSLLYNLIPHGFNKQIYSYWDALYFSIVTVTTLGYGDIAPILPYTKVIASLESILGLVFFGISINVILEYRNRKEYKRLFQTALQMVDKLIEQLKVSYEGEIKNSKSFDEDLSIVKSLLQIHPELFQFTDYSLQSIYIFSRYIINDFNILSLKSKGIEFLHFSGIITNLQTLEKAPVDKLNTLIKSGEESLQHKLHVVFDNVEILNGLIKKDL
jgi:Ion channel